MHVAKGKRGKKVSKNVRGEVGIMLGYANPLDNFYRIELFDIPRTRVNSIHVNFDVGTFGLPTAQPHGHFSAPSLPISPTADVDSSPAVHIPQSPAPRALLPAPPVPEPEECHVDLSDTADVFQNGAFSPGGEAFDEFRFPNLPNDEWIESNHPDQSTTRSGANYNTTAQAQSSEPPSYQALVNICYTQAMQVYKTSAEVPLSQALNSSDHTGWANAIKAEFDALLKMGKLIEVPKGDPLYERAVKEATPARYVLTKKRDGRMKARGVIQGCFENEDADGENFNYYAHVAQLTTIRSLLFVTPREYFVYATVDIGTAFLLSDDFDKNEPPRFAKFKQPLDGYSKDKPFKLKDVPFTYYRMTGPVYGLRSAPIRWETTLAEHLCKEMGFIRGENEPCVYHHGSMEITMVLFVDDILAYGRKANVEQMFTILDKKFPLREIQWLTPETPIGYVGMIIQQKGKHVSINMKPYCESLCSLAKKHFGTLRQASIPITEPITNLDPLSKDDQKLFRTLLGSVGWLANTARIDLAYAHSRISQHLANPNQGALSAIKQVIRYITGTLDLGITTKAPLTKSNVFTFYTDSDHAGNREPQNNCRSQLGMLAILNGAPFLWKSTVMSAVSFSPVISETLPALSVGEAETTAIANGILEFLRASYVAEEENILDFPSPMAIYTDSSVAEAFMANTCLKTRMKHIDVRQNWVKLIRNAQIAVPVHCPSADNLSDWLTKILSKAKFISNRNQLMSSL